MSAQASAVLGAVAPGNHALVHVLGGAVLLQPCRRRVHGRGARAPRQARRQRLPEGSRGLPAGHGPRRVGAHLPRGPCVAGGTLHPAASCRGMPCAHDPTHAACSRRATSRIGHDQGGTPYRDEQGRWCSDSGRCGRPYASASAVVWWARAWRDHADGLPLTRAAPNACLLCVQNWGP